MDDGRKEPEMETQVEPRVGYRVLVTVYDRDEGKQSWHRDFDLLDDADEYGAQVEQVNWTNGNAWKVTVAVWQTENGEPETEMWALRRRLQRRK